jgi:hypothetical protein
MSSKIKEEESERDKQERRARASRVDRASSKIVAARVESRPNKSRREMGYIVGACGWY